MNPTEIDHGVLTVKEICDLLQVSPVHGLQAGQTGQDSAEWDFFSRADDPFLKDPVDDSVRPVMAEGMSELVDDGYRITDEVWLESTPGHTPGHFAVRIASKGQNGVITGDLMHHPIQCRYPEWDDNFDTDGPMAKKTRRAFCERYADSGVLVFGTHFALPSPGKISKKDDSFRFSLVG